MKQNRSILSSTISASLAIALVISSLPSADAAYWQRNRNRRGGGGDNSSGGGGGGNSSSGIHSRGRDLDRDGIPNIIDPDVDNDGVPNGEDRNVDGGTSKSGPLRGRYIGDRLPNNHPAETDIDDDGLADNSPAELDIDGDGVANTADDDIDGDGVVNADDTDDDGDGVLDADDATPSGADGSAIDPTSTAPTTLVGVTYVLKQPDGTADYTLNFTSATAGNETFGTDVTEFTYVFTPAGPTATLRVQYKADKWDDYEFNYLAKSFVRSEYDKNSLRDVDTGTFEPGTNPGGGGTGGGAPVGDGNAPAAVTGVTWVVKQSNGTVEANLVFATATNGSENDPDGDIDPFSYVYTANGKTASLRLDFKPGRWDEYDLDFATGQYTRREFKADALDDTDTGIFALPTP